MKEPNASKQCLCCGGADKHPDADYCPMCEQAMQEQQEEIELEQQRQMENRLWIEQNGPDGHGPK